MNARVTTLKIRHGKMEEAVKIFKESIWPTEKPPNFIDGTLLVNHVAHTMVIITIWENEDAMLESERTGFYNQQISKLSDLNAEPPEREIFEVSVPLQAYAQVKTTL